jgi:hypothetical protein
VLTPLEHASGESATFATVTAGSNQEPWVHVGRLWTNGEPFLAVDAALRDAWRGLTEDHFDQVVELAQHETSISVGAGRAVLVGGDGVVRDDSWMEVFTSADGTIAIVQASGSNYPHALADALNHPHTEDEPGDTLIVGSGELAIFSAADDGTGPYSVPLLPAEPGPVPLVHGPPSRQADPGLLLQTGNSKYRLKIRWYTRLDDNSCFARLAPRPSAKRRLMKFNGAAPSAADADAANREQHPQTNLDRSAH